MLCAFVEVQRISTSASRTSVAGVRQDASSLYESVLCDNLG
jgi:hypothetical protein